MRETARQQCLFQAPVPGSGSSAQPIHNSLRAGSLEAAAALPARRLLVLLPWLVRAGCPTLLTPSLGGVATPAGTLPPEWGYMPQLQVLDASYNTAISGTLPPEWNSLEQLQQLSLAGMSLSGTVPASWASMGNLKWLSLMDNCGVCGALPNFPQVPSCPAACPPASLPARPPHCLPACLCACVGAAAGWTAEGSVHCLCCRQPVEGSLSAVPLAILAFSSCRPPLLP